MSLGNRYLALIPARSGSKRLPGKNILGLAGRPMIAWTIEAARRSARITDVVVSTDSEEIARVARNAGAETPFLRPAELASDTSSVVNVVLHSLSHLERAEQRSYDYVVVLQPTSPLRTHCDIDAAIQTLEDKHADAVISVCPVDHPPVWSNILPADLSLRGFLPSTSGTNPRTQDLPPYYRLNGAIYVCSVERLRTERSLYISSNIFAHLMDRRHSVDVDDEVDFEYAEFLCGRRPPP